MAYISSGGITTRAFPEGQRVLGDVLGDNPGGQQPARASCQKTETCHRTASKRSAYEFADVEGASGSKRLAEHLV